MRYINDISRKNVNKVQWLNIIYKKLPIIWYPYLYTNLSILDNIIKFLTYNSIILWNKIIAVLYNSIKL